MKKIDFKSMLIGFLLCAVGVLTMGVTNKKGKLGTFDTIRAKNIVVINDNDEFDNMVILTPTSISASSHIGDYMTINSKSISKSKNPLSIFLRS